VAAPMTGRAITADGRKNRPSIKKSGGNWLL